MQERTRIAIVAAITALAVVVFFSVLARAVWFAPEDTSPAPSAPVTAEAPPLPAQEPVRLIIPSIGVNANVQQVGINAKGNMGVPNNFTDVAWYKLGPSPGQRGSAVIDGHVDNGLGLPGVFKNLASVKVGDDLEVQTKEGSLLHFTVEKTQTYPYQSVPVQAIFGPSDAARLNLITCDGAWVAGQKTYDHRLVVFARLSAAP